MSDVEFTLGATQGPVQESNIFVGTVAVQSVGRKSVEDYIDFLFQLTSFLL